MNAPAPVPLHRLPSLASLFAFLNAGRHLNRLHDHTLWIELEREREAYERLFAALGFSLRIDERGFAWFQVEEASATVSKTTRQLALLFMLIFEAQADAGLQLERFADWRIDAGLLDALIERNRLLLEAEGLVERETLEQLLKSATTYGFATLEAGGHWRLLPAVYRYLDRFEAVADAPGNETSKVEPIPADEPAERADAAGEESEA